MNYQSTRDLSEKKYSAAQIIKQGLADDGGLFVPSGFSYKKRCNFYKAVL